MDDIARTTLRVPASLLRRVAAFRFAQQIENKSDALVLLIETGLDTLAPVRDKEAAK